jgi:two-component system, NtrC family, response regulator AtoC
MQEQVSDLHHTYPPEAPAAHPGGLEVLVYLRQQCTVFHLPESGTVRVGRSPSNDLRIEDPSVSRFHFALHVGDVIEVEDLGSANGTSLFRNEADPIADEPTHRNDVDGRLAPAERRTLGPGDFIRAGIALILVQIPSGLHPLAVSAISSRPPGDIGPPVLLDPAMKRAYEIAVRAAQSGISVLITGETGAGKEIFAETIHARSNRRGRPLLRLNCAALSETLLESELFGHERGSFTGATHTKVGLLESNDQGTVFLDEIGEMPLSTQAKLLRVLEEKTILRVGATKPRSIDVRFIWATNRDLRAEARLGKFRNDLYYRIAGVEFSIPPLRERPLEIEPLARLFLERFCRRSGLPMPRLSEDAALALQRYSWPGNVRELKNVMERAPLLCGAGAIEAEHIPQDAPDESGLFPPEDLEATDVFIPARAAAGGGKASPPAWLHPEPGGSAAARLGEDPEAARVRITQALEQCAGNQTRAAQLLGVSRRTLINHLERLNMPRPKKV